MAIGKSGLMSAFLRPLPLPNVVRIATGGEPGVRNAKNDH